MNEPAFPSHYEIVVGSKLEENEKVLLRSKEGMTLRDYFASDAMNGICLNTRDTVELDNKSTAKCIAKLAYEIADAMLEARKQ